MHGGGQHGGSVLPEGGPPGPPTAGCALAMLHKITKAKDKMNYSSVIWMNHSKESEKLYNLI